MPRVTPSITRNVGQSVAPQAMPAMPQGTDPGLTQESAGLARAVGTLGAVAAARAEMIRRQAEEDRLEAEALKGANELREVGFGLVTGDEGYLNKPGSEALASYKETAERLQTGLDEVVARSSDPRVRAILQRQRDQLLGSYQERMARHYGVAARQSLDANRDVAIDTERQEFAMAVANGESDARDAALRRLRENITEAGKERGLTPVQVKAWQEAEVSQLWHDTVLGQLKRGDPELANETLQGHKDEIFGQQFGKLQTAVQDALKGHRMRKEVAGWATSAEGSLADRQAALQEKALAYEKEKGLAEEDVDHLWSIVGVESRRMRAQHAVETQRMADEAREYLEQNPDAVYKGIPNIRELEARGEAKQFADFIANGGRVLRDDPDTIAQLERLIENKGLMQLSPEEFQSILGSVKLTNATRDRYQKIYDRQAADDVQSKFANQWKAIEARTVKQLMGEDAETFYGSEFDDLKESNFDEWSRIVERHAEIIDQVQLWSAAHRNLELRDKEEALKRWMAEQWVNAAGETRALAGVRNLSDAEAGQVGFRTPSGKLVMANQRLRREDIGMIKRAHDMISAAQGHDPQYIAKMWEGILSDEGRLYALLEDLTIDLNDRQNLQSALDDAILRETDPEGWQAELTRRREAALSPQRRERARPSQIMGGNPTTYGPGRR